MINIKNTVGVLPIFLLLSCAISESVCERVAIDLDAKAPVSDVERYIHVDEVMPVLSENEYIADASKAVVYKTDVFLLERIQKKVFRLDTKTGAAKSIGWQIGSARNEYHDITDIAIDSDGNLYIYDSESRKVNVYTKDGAYIKTIKGRYGESIVVMPDGGIGYNAGGMTMDTAIVAYSSRGEMKISAQQKISKNAVSMRNGHPIALDDAGRMIYALPFDNSIYCASGADWKSMVQFDFGRKNATVDKIDKMKYGQFQEYLLKTNDVLCT